MHHRVTQQVLKGRQHTLEHLPIEFAGRALHHQLRSLVRIGRSLTHDARQPLHVALE